MINKIPNILSSLRIVLIPFLFLFINNQKIFLTIVIIAAITDILDGFIARRFNIATKKGASLDAIADNLFMISALICIGILFPEIIKENMTLAVILLYIINIMLKLFVLKKIVFIHLYSGKLSAWAGYFFILYTIIFGYNKLVLYIVAIVYITRLIEEILIIIKKRKVNENTKSIFIK